MKKFFILSVLISCFIAFHVSCVSSVNPNPFKSGYQSSEGSLYKLVITTNVPGAHIYVNGNFMGNGYLATHFRSAVYRIEVKAKNYNDWVYNLNLNQSWTLNVKMVPQTKNQNQDSQLTN